jgi:hypothetical protein
LISARRHRQSDLLLTRVPFSLVKGSGSLALEGVEPGRVTGQSAPSSSTAAAAATSPVVATTPGAAVFAITVADPATVSTATASMTTVDRSLNRAELMITWALLPRGVVEESAGSTLTGVDELKFRGS